MKLAVLSDTHNLLRPEVLAELKDADAILHAGDIGGSEILSRLEAVAPVYCVRGNADGEWAEAVPPFLDFTLDGLRLYMAHRKKDLPPDLTPYDLVVFGHSHQYSETVQGGTQLLNPGSCGPRRFRQPVTLAIADLSKGQIRIEKIEIARAVPVPKTGQADLKKQIEAVIRETEKGRSPQQIAQRHRMDPQLAEQIARLYLTHPGVTADGIMTKMGL